MPSPDLSIPGVAQNLSEKTPVVGSFAYADITGAAAMTMQFREAIPHTRGPQDISLFRQTAPSVVLILAKDALGSGSLLQDNVILTNFHVVDHNGVVTVVFKPADPGGRPTEDEVVKADVVKIDVQRDLAFNPAAVAPEPHRYSATDFFAKHRSRCGRSCYWAS
jgi:S1-C subfamily serine protease